MENKFFDRNESSLTKHYCIRSKFTVFWEFLTISFKQFFYYLQKDSKCIYITNWKGFFYLQSILLCAIWTFFRFSVVYFILKIFLVVGLTEISLGMKMYFVKMIQNGGCYVSSWNNSGDTVVENIINYCLRSTCDLRWNIYCGIKRIWVHCVNGTWYVSLSVNYNSRCSCWNPP